MIIQVFISKQIFLFSLGKIFYFLFLIFRLPKNPEYRSKWLEFIQQQHLTKNISERNISNYSSLCSNHFKPNDFLETGMRNKKLKKSAIPSINHHQQQQQQQKQQPELQIQEQHPPVEIVIEEDPVVYELCGLCRTPSHQLHPIDEFATVLIRKCIPFIHLNFNLCLMQKMCIDCVAILNTFSSFIDKILIAQNMININQDNVHLQNEIIPRTSIEERPIHYIKTEDDTSVEDEAKVPFLTPINFEKSPNHRVKPYTTQKKLEILEIVDIKPLNFLPIETNALNCSDVNESSSYEENECQILSPPQLKVEITDGDNELELIKSFVQNTTILLHDHNYVMENQPITRKVKDECDNEAEIIQITENIKKKCCKRTFKSFKKFLLHKIFKHKQMPRKQCKKCLKTFPNDINFRYHKIQFCIGSKERSKKTHEVLKKIVEKSKLIVKEPKRRKNYSCQICMKKFHGPKNLYQHKLSHQENSKCCGICGKMFKRMHGLKQHIKAQHEKQKLFNCQVCQHAYSLKTDMKRCKHRDLKRSLGKLKH